MIRRLAVLLVVIAFAVLAVPLLRDAVSPSDVPEPDGSKTDTATEDPDDPDADAPGLATTPGTPAPAGPSHRPFHYFALPFDRRDLLRSPEKPQRIRELEAAHVAGHAEFDGEAWRLDILDDEDAVQLYFGRDDDRLLLLGFAIDRESLEMDVAWFEPAVLLADGPVSLDAPARTVDLEADAVLMLSLGFLSNRVEVELTGTATVAWRSSPPVEAGDRRWEDVIALDLELAVTANAEMGGLPIERELVSGVSGVLARGEGWVELRDTKRRYVLESTTGDG